MSGQKTLLEEVSSFSNLYQAYKLCRRGKRDSKDYQRLLFAVGERFKRIEGELLENRYRWGSYKEFWVFDPKRRLVMCAPFLDRVVHHAICRIIDPILDPVIPDCVWACRKGKGNKAAVIALQEILSGLGQDRFSMKLDVKKYFSSINHEVLLKKIMSCLRDDTLNTLLRSLLASHPEFRARGTGIPIGNLTSQLFANFYLVSADEIGISQLPGGYLRYMDDIALIGKDKGYVLDTADVICRHVEDELKLSVPFNKQIYLGADPVPFLGYVVDGSSYRVLSRTKRRFRKKLAAKEKAGASESELHQMQVSFEAWGTLG